MRENSQKSFEFFNQMKNTIGIDDYAYNCLISSCALNYNMELAITLVKEMKSQGFNVSLHTYNTLLNGYQKAGQMEEAEKIFSELIQLGLKPTIETYNTMISGYIKLEQLENAIFKVNSMQQHNIFPDHITSSLLYCQFIKQQNKMSWDTWKELEKTIMQCGVKPHRIVYNSLIEKFAKLNLYNEAQAAFTEMLSAGWKPNWLTAEKMLQVYNSIQSIEGIRAMQTILNKTKNHKQRVVEKRIAFLSRNQNQSESLFQ